MKHRDYKYLFSLKLDITKKIKIRNIQHTC